MSKPSKRCPGAYFPTLLHALEDQLRKGEYDKLAAAAPLFEATDEANFGAVLQTMFGADDKSALTKFNNLVSDLREQSRESNGLNIRADTKRTDPSKRVCWIEAYDQAITDLEQSQGALIPVIQNPGRLIQSRGEGLDAADLAMLQSETVRISIVYDDSLKTKAKQLIARIRNSVRVCNLGPIEWVDIHDVPAGVARDSWMQDIRFCRAHLFLLSPSIKQIVISHNLESLTGVPHAFVQLEETNPGLYDTGFPEEELTGLRGRSFSRSSNKDAFAQDSADLVISKLIQDAESASPGLPFIPLITAFQTQCEHYTPSRALEASQLPQTPEEIPVGNRNAPLAQDLLEKWMVSTVGPRFAVVLGEYGIGKTTLLQMFAKAWNAKEPQDPIRPQLFYVDLRAYIPDIRAGKPVEVEELLRQCLKQSQSGASKILTPKRIIEAVRTKNAVLIFDGLDEQMTHLDQAGGKAFMRALWDVVEPHETFGENPSPNVGRLIFSCRSHFFKSISDFASTMKGHEGTLVKETDYRYIHLLPFDEDQIQEYLVKALGQEDGALAWETLGKIHNLRDLATRPVLLSLITGQIHRLEAIRQERGAVLSTDLYATLVERSLERDEGKHSLNEEDKKRLMRQLALDLWRSGRREWEWEEVDGWMKRQLKAGDYIYSAERMPQILEDLRNATFVVRQESTDSKFRFSHTSIQEYFLACRMVESLKETNPLEVWDVPHPSLETLTFVAELLSRDKRALDGLSRLLEAPHQQATMSGLRVWEIANFEEFPIPNPTPLNCSGLDFVQVEFSGTPDRPLTWNGSLWERANLRSARFLYVSLEEASFENAQLAGAEYRGPTATPFDQAWLVGFGEWTDQGETHRTPGPQTASSFVSAQVRGGHIGVSVHSCKYSPDGQFIVSASDDNTLKIWDAETGREINTLRGHRDRVTACHYSPDGQFIVSGSYDETIKIWDTKTGREIMTFKGHEQPVRSCHYAPDGQRIVSASDNKTIKLWDAKTGKEVKTLEGHTDWVQACHFSPNGKYLVSASDDKTLKIWDAKTGKEIKALEGHQSSVLACNYSPDGQKILSASYDRTIKIWDAKTGKQVRTLNGHALAVSSCHYSPDGRTIASASEDNTIKIWDAKTGKEIRTLRGHKGAVSSCHYSPDGRTIVSASDDNTIKIWDANTGKEIRTLKRHTSPVTSLSYSPDGQNIASASVDTTIKIWEVKTGSEVKSYTLHPGTFTYCNFSPDGQNIASASVDTTIKIWEVKTGKTIKALVGHEDWVSSCNYSPDGQNIVSGSNDNTIKIWDVKTGKEIKTLRGHTHSVSSCNYSPDGQTIVSASYDKTIKVWDAETGKEINTLRGHTNLVTACHHSPDGQFIVSASRDNTIKIWDARSGAEIRTLRGHKSAVNACNFSPDGQSIASASDDKTLKIWDAKTAKEIKTLRVHIDSICACQYSPDGQTIVSSSRDGTVIVWDAKMYEPILQWGHADDDQGWTFDFRLGKFTRAEINSPDVVSLVCYDEEEGRLRAFPPPYIPQER